MNALWYVVAAAGAATLLLKLPAASAATSAGNGTAAAGTKPPAETAPRRTSSGSSGSSGRTSGGNTDAHAPGGFDADLRAYQAAQNSYQMAVNPARPAPILAVDGLWGPYTRASLRRIEADVRMLTGSPALVREIAQLPRYGGRHTESQMAERLREAGSMLGGIGSAADWRRANGEAIASIVRVLTEIMRQSEAVRSHVLRRRGTSTDPLRNN